MTPDPLAFIAARLQEEEADALESKNAPEGTCRFLDADRWTEALSWQANEDFVLRRVKTMRAILALHCGRHECPGGDGYAWYGDDEAPWCPTVRHVASMWDDHPDYRQEWASAG